MCSTLLFEKFQAKAAHLQEVGCDVLPARYDDDERRSMSDTFP